MRSVLDEIAPQTFENVPQIWQEAFPVPRIDGHKYARGHAVVVSGDLASTGAARLAARGALRAGAGLVTRGLAARCARRQCRGADRGDGARRSIRAVEFAELLDDKRLNACVIGPGAGVGERTRDFVHDRAVGEDAISCWTRTR